VLTPFFGKTGQKDKKEQLIRKQRQLADWRERKGWSTGLADGQKNSTLSTDWRVNQSVDGQPEDWSIERKKAVIKEIRQKESTVEAGQSMIGNGSKVSF
jgi:hypothetical protein